MPLRRAGVKQNFCQAMRGQLTGNPSLDPGLAKPYDSQAAQGTVERKTMNSKPYFAGVHAVDVTPDPGCRLCGHSARKALAKRVHDPLMLKALVIGRGGKWVALVSSDLIRIPRPMVQRLRAKARRRLGLAPDCLLLTSSHTHTGPFTANEPRTPGGLTPPGYPERIESAILGAIAMARKTAAPARLAFGRGRVNIGSVNRRLRGPGGIAVMAPNFDGAKDDGVPVLSVRRADGSLLAALAVYACHPTTISTDISEISGDYPGAFQRALESRNPGAIAMFMNGCCGDVRPAIIRNKSFAGGSFADVARMGNLLCAEANRTLKSAAPLNPAPIFTRLRSVRLPLLKGHIPDNARQLAALCKAYRATHPEWSEAILAWKREMAARLRGGGKIPRHVSVDVQCIRIGGVALLGISGEVFAELGLQMNREYGDRFATVCLANGSVAYLPTEEALAEDGYERINFVFRGLSAPLDPCSASRLLRAAGRILR